ncbi:MAG: Wzz/FepE/Etk N-terminal domain-containing protein, partial [Chloroflexota bacterium]|nr:Wzz/FepE/Etk N-terminal domain-containing protein [Chloroflexota bacterium]
MELREYWRIIVQRGWIVVLAVVLTAGSAYLWSAAQTPEYKATAQLIVLPHTNDWGRLQTLKQRLASYTAQIRSEATAFRVVDDLRLDVSPYELLGRVAVRPELDRMVIQIDATDRDPQLAGQIANGFAEDFRAEIAKEQSDQLREDRIDVN